MKLAIAPCTQTHIISTIFLHRYSTYSGYMAAYRSITFGSISSAFCPYDKFRAVDHHQYPRVKGTRPRIVFPDSKPGHCSPKHFVSIDPDAPVLALNESRFSALSPMINLISTSFRRRIETPHVMSCGTVLIDIAYPYIIPIFRDRITWSEIRFGKPSSIDCG